MSVVAWDGKTLAADRMGVSADMRSQMSKIMVIGPPPEIIAWTGSHEQGLTLAAWYRAGADPESWPEFQKDHDNWTRLIVWRQGENPEIYEQLPVPQTVQDEFMAWGSGRDFAMGAMFAGASAADAVRAASAFNIYCGLGIDQWPKEDYE